MNRNEILMSINSYLKEEWVHPVEKVENDNNLSSEKCNALKELEITCLNCQKCILYKTAKNLVFSDGSIDSEIVFIGEAPGADEDEQGKPFVGRAGKLLTSTIEENGLPRNGVYICNILKHRPPENRNPLPDEIAACTPHLIKQLALIQPKLIITLGNFSTKFMLNTDEGISKLRGTIKESPLGYKIMPTYHPAAVLRNMNLINDLKNDIASATKFAKKS